LYSRGIEWRRPGRGRAGADGKISRFLPVADSLWA